MTRQREDRRRDYREAPPYYRPSDDPEYYRPPSRQWPARRYQEDDYFYEERPRYREQPRQARERPRQPRVDRQREHPPRRPNPRTGYPRQSYDREQRQRPYSREQGYEERYPLQQAKKSTNTKTCFRLSITCFSIP